MPTFKHTPARYDELIAVIAKQRALDLFNGALNERRTEDIKEILKRNGIELKAKNIKVATDLFYFGRVSVCENEI